MTPGNQSILSTAKTKRQREIEREYDTFNQLDNLRFDGQWMGINERLEIRCWNTNANISTIHLRVRMMYLNGDIVFREFHMAITSDGLESNQRFDVGHGWLLSAMVYEDPGTSTYGQTFAIVDIYQNRDNFHSYHLISNWVSEPFHPCWPGTALIPKSGGAMLVTPVTKNCAKSRSTATSSTASNVFINVPNMLSISCKIKQIVAYSLSIQKVTAGTGSWQIKGVTSSTVYASGSIGVSAVIVSGTFVMSATELIKVQYKSSDANNFSVRAGSSASSQMGVGDFVLIYPTANTIGKFDCMANIASLDYCIVSPSDNTTTVYGCMGSFKVGDADAIVSTWTPPSKSLITSFSYMATATSPNIYLIFSYTGDAISQT